MKKILKTHTKIGAHLYQQFPKHYYILLYLEKGEFASQVSPKGTLNLATRKKEENCEEEEEEGKTICQIRHYYVLSS